VAALTFAFNLQLVGVPSSGPLLSILVNGIEEEIMEKPDIQWAAGIEMIMDFEIMKEILPLLPKPMSEIVPETLDPSIVDTPLKLV
jgi:hypothetical protein